MLFGKTHVTDFILRHVYAEDQWLTNPVMDKSFIAKSGSLSRLLKVAALVTELSNGHCSIHTQGR